ncbi:MAG: hypothetical protein V4724_26850 [Pseudomonadota bacterium]
MQTKSTTITGRVASVSINGDIDMELAQVGAVFVTCWMVGRGVTKVVADDGIEFASGLISLLLPAGTVITDMCDLPALGRQIAAEQEEAGQGVLDRHLALAE